MRAGFFFYFPSLLFVALRQLLYNFLYALGWPFRCPLPFNILFFCAFAYKKKCCLYMSSLIEKWVADFLLHLSFTYLESIKSLYVVLEWGKVVILDQL